MPTGRHLDTSGGDSVWPTIWLSLSLGGLTSRSWPMAINRRIFACKQKQLLCVGFVHNRAMQHMECTDTSRESIHVSHTGFAICSPPDREREYSVCAAADAGYGAIVGSLPTSSEEAAAALSDLVWQ